MNIDPPIAVVLDAICRERDDLQYKEAFTAAQALLEAYGESSDLADRLFEAIPRTVPWELVAELFDILVWKTSDNGAAITRTIENWLIQGKDNRKLLIALHLDVYPFIDEKQMKTVLKALTSTNVNVLARCKQLLAERLGTQ